MTFCESKGHPSIFKAILNEKKHSSAIIFIYFIIIIVFKKIKKKKEKILLGKHKLKTSSRM